MQIVLNTFYALFILLLIGVAGLFLATMLPIPGNVEVKIVKSGSMEPTIPTGSVVIVAPATQYVANDVVTFGKDTKAEIPTTHRIISVNPSTSSGLVTYVTKGDANEEQDPTPVARSEVIGKVWAHVPYMGYVLDFARQPWGFTFMIGIPAALIIFDELFRIGREVSVLRRRKRDEEDVTEAFREAEGVPRSGPHVARTARPFDIPRQNYD